MNSAVKWVSVVVPVYNEERTVAGLLDKVWAVDNLGDCGLEIIIVNDGSRDRSDEIISAWCADHPENGFRRVKFLRKANGGKGSAVRCGIAASGGDAVIIQDADLEYDPMDYAVCVLPIINDGRMVVYGSREDSNRNRIYSSPTFYLGALSLTFGMNLLFNSNMTDEPTCYKSFNGDLIRSLEFDGEHFEWEPEVTAKLLRMGFEIDEVGISYYPRHVGDGKKINWKDGVSGLWTALKWRLLPIGAIRRRVAATSERADGVIRHRCGSRWAALAAFVLGALLSWISGAGCCAAAGGGMELFAGMLLCGGACLTVYWTLRLFEAWPVSLAGTAAGVLAGAFLTPGAGYWVAGGFWLTLAMHNFFLLRFVKRKFGFFWITAQFWLVLAAGWVLWTHGWMACGRGCGLWLAVAAADLLTLWFLRGMPVTLKCNYTFFAAVICGGGLWLAAWLIPVMSRPEFCSGVGATECPLWQWLVIGVPALWAVLRALARGRWYPPLLFWAMGGCFAVLTGEPVNMVLITVMAVCGCFSKRFPELNAE